jgi:hypothetical protein
MTHEHDFTRLIVSFCNEQQSKDQYWHCSCGALKHIYTWDPGKIRHEAIIMPPKEYSR